MLRHLFQCFCQCHVMLHERRSVSFSVKSSKKYWTQLLFNYGQLWNPGSQQTTRFWVIWRLTGGFNAHEKYQYWQSSSQLYTWTFLKQNVWNHQPVTIYTQNENATAPTSADHRVQLRCRPLSCHRDRWVATGGRSVPVLSTWEIVFSSSRT